jgi:hypothetical protein
MEENSTYQNNSHQEKRTDTSLPPALPHISPEMEALRHLLERMIENERQRVRNQYLQLAVIIVFLLFGLIGVGIWFANQLFNNVRYERMLLEQQKQPSQQPAYEISQKNIAPSISDLEAKNKQLEAALLAGKTNTETQALLAKQQEELKQLYTELAALQKGVNEKMAKEEMAAAASSSPQEGNPQSNENKTKKPDIQSRNYLTVKMTNSPATLRIPLQLPAK